jgi:cell division protein FtsI (penicillin-binding protein 3)/stage V sporulation protein D (sporulation-specific penicillin-binding protein)
MISKHSLARIRLIASASVLVSFVLVVRLYLVQVIHSGEYEEKADRQYSNPTAELWDRGSIFFTTKSGDSVSAATLRQGFVLAIEPKKIADAEAAFTQLSGYVALDRESFLARAAKQNDPYEEIMSHVDPEVASRLRALALPGVSLHKERWRFYPGENLAAHVLGFVGFDEDSRLSGRYGLERYYEDTLSRADANLYRNFFAEIFLDARKAITKGGEGDIITSIEPSVEQYLEESLQNVVEQFGATQAGGIIMDPMTGRIFGMALSPAFNPNEYGKERDSRRFTNSLVENVYEMGSIVKPITLASGLNARVVTATTTYNDRGTMTLNNKTIANYDGKARGIVDMQEVLSQSLNIGAATVALKLGSERLQDYFGRFGFGKETGIDLPGEAEGLIGNLKSGRDIELVTASYGQGIALTPIQTVRALAALGNGGYLVTPQVVTKVAYGFGTTRSVSASEKIQVIRPETSEEITRMLVRVVDTALLGGEYRMASHSIAAKTGTALIASPEGGYYSDRFLHSFFGYFPAYRPQFIVFLYLVEPQGVTYASHTLTAPFMRIATFLINYYDVPPDR